MSLTQALSTALSGLNATQTGLSLVAGNVANAQTPGYVRKQAVLTESGTGTSGSSVQVSQVQRVLDQFVQTQLRTESAGAGYADVRANMYSQLQGVYGAPGSAGTLESSFNSFTSALQALVTTPNDRSAQSAVINAAQGLTQQLNSSSAGIQALRQQSELAIADGVNQANNAIQQIATLNQRISASAKNDSSAAALEDQRDTYVDQLSKLMDVRVVTSDNNQVSVFTNSGIQLVGSQAGVLSFNTQGTVTPQTKWSANPNQSGLGTITLTTPNGGKIDMITSNAIRSGEIAGYLSMRDNVLVQAQDQLDQFSAALSSGLSDTQTPGAAVTVGAQSGFDVDTAALAPGNPVSVSYTDTATGTQRSVKFVAVVDPSLAGKTTDPNVFQIDISGGTAAAAAQMNAVLAGTGVTASNPAGTSLRFLDDGSSTAQVNAASIITTATSLTGGPALPLFTDGNNSYTGAVTKSGLQSLGLAGSITVNSGLLADPSKLVAYQAGVAAADATRPTFIYDQMVNASLNYSPSAGIGSTAAPFKGSASTYLSQIVSLQSEAANNATQLQQGQDVVLTSLQQRFSDGASVNVDQEMADLIGLQNAYAANARVMSTVKDMITQLLQL